MRTLLIEAKNENEIKYLIVTHLNKMCIFPLLDMQGLSNTSNGFTTEVLQIISEQVIDEIMVIEKTPIKTQLIINALSYNQRYTPQIINDRILIHHNDKQ